MRKMVGLIGLLSMSAFWVVGCAGERELSWDGRRGPNITLQGAANRADEILDSTFGAIRPEVYWAHGETTVGSCDLTRRRVVMTEISKMRRGSFLGLVERHWLKSGYRIKSVINDRVFPAIFAQSADGFGVTLTIGDKGQAFFEVDSPCVRESPVAESTTLPNGPAYDDRPVPRPNVHSDFWSAEVSGPPPSVTS